MRISDWSSDVCSSDLLDARIDARMTRTSWRPIVVGQITPRAAFIFALVLAVLSMTVLLVWVNVLTAVLTFASLLGYAVISTEFLKRAPTQNIVIGGLAGDAPPAPGWVAVPAELPPSPRRRG